MESYYSLEYTTNPPCVTPDVGMSNVGTVPSSSSLEEENNRHRKGNSTAKPLVIESTPAMAALALAITTQGWQDLGQGTNENVKATQNMDVVVERVVSLFLIRIVALVSHQNHAKDPSLRKPNIPRFSDLSTTTICRESLIRKQPWPHPITTDIIEQLQRYIRLILEQYREVYYHNFEHAYHVIISCSKLLDMMLLEEPSSAFHKRGGRKVQPSRKSYGLKSDPLMALALLFSALVHDVEHQGVSNRQLVLESDDLAILYNDQSVAEQRSLAVAFSFLMKPEFLTLREILFESSDEYRRFRKTVINLVLTTDIASPERTQLTKSKWKEAFGDVVKETKTSRRQLQPKQDSARSSRSPARANSRGSMIMTTQGGSTKSGLSDLTMDPSLKRISENNPLSLNDPMLNHQSSLNGKQLMQFAQSLSAIEGVREEEDDSSSTTSVESQDDDDLALLMDPETDPIDGMIKNSTTFSAPQGGGGGGGGEKCEPRVELLALPKPRLVSSPSGESRDTQSTSHLSRGENCPRRVKPTYNRRFSSPGLTYQQMHPKRRLRLGLRRSMDLSGRALEHYHSAKNATAVNGEASLADSLQLDYDPDETDEFKATVVMEHILKAADVGPNLQSWDHMAKWSTRLFYELKIAAASDRGEDPETGWYENQISFLNFYILPLAKKLDDIGVFGDHGPMFATIVENNRDQWMVDGLELTDDIIEEWQTISDEASFISEST